MQIRKQLARAAVALVASATAVMGIQSAALADTAVDASPVASHVTAVTGVKTINKEATA